MNDRSWQPAIDRDALERRAGMISRIRRFFHSRGVLEVNTPVISKAASSDPQIQQVSTSDRQWLRTSPEYALKRMLAAGSGDVFEIGPVFRKGESGRRHNPEFTMLEWYRVGWNYHQLMDEVMELVWYCAGRGNFPRSKIAFRDLFLACTGLDPMNCSAAELAGFAAGRGLEVPVLNMTQARDLVFSHFVQPNLDAKGLTLIFDYPADQAALARIRDADPPVAERFELFGGSMELANGYQELTDPAEQRARFEAENKIRKSGGAETGPLDEQFLAALEHGLPECSGVALGIERLLMFLHGCEHISQVMPFPSQRT